MSQFRMHAMSALVTWFPVVWVFMVGACVGSLVNVLVYRLPKGLPVIVPSSRCPKCDTKLTFRENIPILGWLILRGGAGSAGSRSRPSTRWSRRWSR
jgi:leader peptidase (prepilin peptidase)/N-methyltransferase